MDTPQPVFLQNGVHSPAQPAPVSPDSGQDLERAFIDNIFKDNRGDGYIEYLPVDNFFDDYLSQLDTDPALAGGQNKGARLPPEPGTLSCSCEKGCFVSHSVLR